MGRAISLLCAFLILAVGPPSNAQWPAPPANATSAFDGTYVGLSAENNSSGNTLSGGRERTQGYAGARSCTTFRAPARLTIANGRARVRWGDRTLEGNVAPDGSLTMSNRIRTKVLWADRGPTDQGPARGVLRIHPEMAKTGLTRRVLNRVETGRSLAG
jgi:hypothetical protein